MRALLVLLAACHGKSGPGKVIAAVTGKDDAELARVLDNGGRS